MKLSVKKMRLMYGASIWLGVLSLIQHRNVGGFFIAPFRCSNPKKVSQLPSKVTLKGSIYPEEIECRVEDDTKSTIRLAPYYTDPSFNKAGKRLEILNKPLQELIFEETAVVIPTSGGCSFVIPANEEVESKRSLDCSSPIQLYQPLFLDHQCDSLQKIASQNDTLICYLGEKDGRSFYVLDSASLAKEYENNPLVRVDSLRKLGDLIASEPHAALLAYARGMSTWHRTNQFCPACGSSTKLYKVGAGRSCTSCRHKSYPRLDPAIITLITYKAHGQEYALMGKKKQWSAGMYSCLSGFAEIGESLEECLIREVFEESGVHVDSPSISFLGSQPWPFPHSLMIGFIAQAANRNLDRNGLPIIDFDENELQDVRWFSKSYVAEKLAAGSQCPSEFCIPRKASLANKIIKFWAFG